MLGGRPSSHEHSARRIPPKAGFQPISGSDPETALNEIIQPDLKVLSRKPSRAMGRQARSRVFWKLRAGHSFMTVFNSQLLRTRNTGAPSRSSAIALR